MALMGYGKAQNGKNMARIIVTRTGRGEYSPEKPWHGPTREAHVPEGHGRDAMAMGHGPYI